MTWLKTLPCGALLCTLWSCRLVPAWRCAPFDPGVYPRGVWATSSTWYMGVVQGKRRGLGVLLKEDPLQDRLHAPLQHPRSHGSGRPVRRAVCPDEPGNIGTARVRERAVVVARLCALAPVEARLFSVWTRVVLSVKKSVVRCASVDDPRQDDDR